MRLHTLVVPIAIAAFATACGETTTQKAGTGAAGGAVAGAVVGGPVGALVGAGVGGAGGAYRDTIDEKVDDAAGKAEQEISQATTDRNSGASTARSAERTNRGSGDTRTVSRAMQPANDLTNRQVRDAQTALKDLGLYKGRIDGLYGPRTIRAVKEFQSQQDMARTGALTGETEQRLQRVASNNGGAGAPRSPQSDQVPQRDQAPQRDQMQPERDQQAEEPNRPPRP